MPPRSWSAVCPLSTTQQRKRTKTKAPADSIVQRWKEGWGGGVMDMKIQNHTHQQKRNPTTTNTCKPNPQIRRMGADKSPTNEKKYHRKMNSLERVVKKKHKHPQQLHIIHVYIDHGRVPSATRKWCSAQTPCRAQPLLINNAEHTQTPKTSPTTQHRLGLRYVNAFAKNTCTDAPGIKNNVKKRTTH